MQDHLYHERPELPELCPGHVVQYVALVLLHGPEHIQWIKRSIKKLYIVVGIISEINLECQACSLQIFFSSPTYISLNLPKELCHVMVL